MDKIKTSLLLDFYEKMLTEKQSKILRLYNDFDVSITELAEGLELSRQAVYDTIKSAETYLEKLEDSLGLVKDYLSYSKNIQYCIDEIDKLDGAKSNKNLQNIRKTLVKLLKN